MNKHTGVSRDTYKFHQYAISVVNADTSDFSKAPYTAPAINELEFSKNTNKVLNDFEIVTVVPLGS